MHTIQTMTERSYSEISCFQACERKWHLRYILRRAGNLVPADRLVRGKIVHQWLAAWWSANPIDYPADPNLRAMCKGYEAVYQRPHLKNVSVNVPFLEFISDDLTLVGEVDGLGYDDDGLVILEHKTTSSDIAPGSLYWRKVESTDRQVSIYLRAWPKARVLYDVLRKPAFRAGDVEGKALADMSENPGRYFARHTVVRLTSEEADTDQDLVGISQRMRWAGRSGRPRNPDACHNYGDECEFFSVCWHGKNPMSLPEWNDDSFECQRGKNR
jgi:hypothetical protein